MAIDIYTPRELMTPLEQVPEPRTFILDTFFPTKEIHDTPEVDIDIVKGGRVMAPFVSPILAGTVMKVRGYSTKTFAPPYIKPKTPFTPRDLMQRLPGETIYGSGLHPANRLSYKVGKGLAELRKTIVRREEWMAAQGLLTGKVVVIGEGVNDEVDFGMAASHKIVLAGEDKWDADTSNPISDLVDWKQLIARDSGWTPTVAVCGSDVEKAILSNKKLLEVLDVRRVELGQIAPKDLPNGVTYIGRVKDIDFYGYAEWYADDETGDMTPVIPADKMILGHPGTRAIRHYGLIQDLDAMKRPIAAMVDYFPKTWSKNDPSVDWLMLQSAPLPVPHEIDAFAVIDVL